MRRLHLNFALRVTSPLKLRGSAAAAPRKHLCVGPLPFMAFAEPFSGAFGRRLRVYTTRQMAFKVAYIWGRRLRWGERRRPSYILRNPSTSGDFYLSALEISRS